jgi:transcriptional regulator with XRE-family HTH domain
MYNLTKKEKLQFVLRKQKETQFSAGLISKGTGISEAGLQKIIQGKSTSPQEKTLNLILEFFERKETGTSIETISDKKQAPDYIDIPKTHELQQEIISLYRELKELRAQLSACEKSKI